MYFIWYKFQINSTTAALSYYSFYDFTIKTHSLKIGYGPWGEVTVPRSVPERHNLPLFVFWNKYAALSYSRFILLLSLFFTAHLVPIILFNHNYLNSTTVLLCLCFYSLCYHFVNLHFICNNNNLYIRLSFDFTYDTDEEILDLEIYLSIISNDVILMFL